MILSRRRATAQGATTALDRTAVPVAAADGQSATAPRTIKTRDDLRPPRR